MPRLSFICILLGALSCTNGPAIPAACDQDLECGDKALCSDQGRCVSPWDTLFEVRNCKLELKTFGSEPQPKVLCFWIHPRKSGPYVDLPAGDWSACEGMTTFTGVPESAHFRCGYFDKDTPEDEMKGGDFCLDEGCPPFTIQHFRGEQRVELHNARGDTFSFELRRSRLVKDRPENDIDPKRGFVTGTQ